MLCSLYRVSILFFCLLPLCCKTQAVAYASDLYVISGQGATTISRITPSGSISTFVTGLQTAQDLAFDPAGNLYVSVVGDNSIKKITPSGSISTFATGFELPGVLAFGPDGLLYVSDFFGDVIKRVTIDGVVSTYLDGIRRPIGLAFDTDQTLFFGNATYNTPVDGFVWAVDSSGAPSLAAQNRDLFVPFRMTFDSQGTLYVANLSSSFVVTVTPEGTVGRFGFHPSLRGPSGLAFDAEGALFIVNSIDGEIYKATPDGTTERFIAGIDRPIGLAIAPAAVPETGGTLLILIGSSVLLVLYKRRL